MRKPAPQFSHKFGISHGFFYTLLKHSLSLNISEKVRVLESLPNLSYIQVIELQRVFIAEYLKFEILAQEHPKDIQTLMERAFYQWAQLEEMYEFPPLLSEGESYTQMSDFIAEHGLDDSAQDVLAEFERGVYLKNKAKANHDNPSDVATKDDESSEVLTKTATKDTTSEEGADNDNGDDDIDNDMDDESLETNKADDSEDKDDEEDDFDFSTYDKVQAFEHFYKNHKTTRQLKQSAKKPTIAKPAFNSPKEAIEAIGKKVIGQNHALEKLATMLYYHRIFKNEAFKMLSLSESEDDTPEFLYTRQMPILLIGSTGTGKTHLVQNLANLYGQTVTFVDCSVLVRTGIVGVSVDTIGRMIYENNEKNIQKAEYSIVFLDEFDKLFLPRGDSNGRSNADLATQLLTMVEGSTPIPVEYRGMGSSADYPTFIKSDNMLFVLAGSFGIHTKFMGKSIGFHQSTTNRLNDFASQTALTELGLPDELAGRIGQVISLNSLNDDDYVKVLYQSPTSPWNILQNQLTMVECTAELPEEVVRTLIKNNQVALQKFGARGLYQAFNALPCTTKILLQALESPNQHFVVTLD